MPERLVWQRQAAQPHWQRVLGRSVESISDQCTLGDRSSVSGCDTFTLLQMTQRTLRIDLKSFCS